MVGAAAGDDAVLEDRLQRLEVAEPVVAELGGERAGIEIEPGGLDVGDDAEPGHLLDRLAAHEVAVRDAGAGRADGRGLVGFVVGIEQRVNGAVADAVGRELQAGFDRRFDDGAELVGLDHQHAAIVRVANEIDVGQAPRLAHVGAAGEHAAVEKALDADDLQGRIVFAERMLGDLADFVLNCVLAAIRIDAVRNPHSHAQPTRLAELLVVGNRVGRAVPVGHGRQADGIVIAEQLLQPSQPLLAAWLIFPTICS